MKHFIRQAFRILLSAFCIALLIAGSAKADPAISNVRARQRWPWNCLVDVDFSLTGAGAGEVFFIDISATAEKGSRTFRASCFKSEPLATNGANRVVWDFGEDYPDYRADDVRVTVTATPISDSTPVYMVVDLSGGASATSYPVHYTTNAPTMTVGQEDPCKTTELWLRRIKAGAMALGNGNGYYAGNPDNGFWHPRHVCVLTNDYYIGIFPLTQAQACNVRGACFSYFTNETCRATRPMDAAKITSVRGTAFDFPPRSAAKTGDTILRRLEERTGLPFDLPTEEQWEFAMRAGSTLNGGMYPGGATLGAEWDSYSSLPEPRNAGSDCGTAYVDYGKPNDWGIYLVYGNVREWCLNRALGKLKEDATYCDPIGGTAKGDKYTRYVRRGRANGSYSGLYVYDSSADLYVKDCESVRNGARVCLTLP